MKNARTLRQAVPGPQENVDDILTHCFIMMGTATGGKPIDFDAAVWLHGHFHKLFKTNIEKHHLHWGNGDPAALRAATMLGHFAAIEARYRDAITVEDVTKAARKVDKICRPSGTQKARLRGVWCE